MKGADAGRVKYVFAVDGQRRIVKEEWEGRGVWEGDIKEEWEGETCVKGMAYSITGLFIVTTWG